MSENIICRAQVSWSDRFCIEILLLRHINHLEIPMLKGFVYSVFVLLSISPALAEENVNRIQIDAPTTFVYQYITQPDSWHDWYPLSKSAKTPGGSLVKGQTFSEVVRINQRDVDFSYRVVESSSPVLWRVEYSSPVVMGSIQYQLF